MSTRLLLVRHGQSTWNADGRWQGQADPPLSALGEEQAVIAAARLEVVGRPDACWSSDLQRARRTAEVLGAPYGQVPKSDPRLRERDAGEWSGLTREEIEAGWPGALATGRRPPSFEADESMIPRIVEVLVLIAAEHPGQTVVVVTHGGVVRVLERHLGRDGGLLANLEGRWLEVGGTTLTFGDRTVLVDAAHVSTPPEI